MSQKPVVALDVDGVLYPWLRPEFGEWLRTLADRADLMWATAWGHAANREIGAVIGLPELPVIEFGSLDKTTALEARCAGRAVAWLDDFFALEHEEWVLSRDAPALLVRVDPREGLQCRHVDSVAAWLADLTRCAC